MNLLVISHKPSWNYTKDKSIFVTDGGFPIQMKALSELFVSTRILVPVSRINSIKNKTELTGNNLTVIPLSSIDSKNKIVRRLYLILWLIQNSMKVLIEIIKADVIHTPIPGDIGTIGMLVSFVLKKPLFVRYCGNWKDKRTVAEKFWKWFLIRYAGGKLIVLATGGGINPPSSKNDNIKWIFSTSLIRNEILKTSKQIKQIRSNIRLVTLCRIEKKKGVDVLIKSMSIISKKYDNIELHIVGDGSQLENYKNLSKELDCLNKIYFHGYLKHAQAIKVLNDSDLFCFPTSSSEGFPKVVLEAMSCNLPIITTDVSVLPLLVGNNCGRIVEEPTPENIAEIIIELIKNPKEYNRLSTNAGQKALNFSIENWKSELRVHFSNSWTNFKSNA